MALTDFLKGIVNPFREIQHKIQRLTQSQLKDGRTHLSLVLNFMQMISIPFEKSVRVINFIFI